MKKYMKPYHESTDRKEIQRAWEDYMAKGILNRTIHPVIIESWEKSRLTQVDPLGIKIPMVPVDTFQYSLEKNRLLMNASNDIIQNLKGVMENSSSVIELFDEKGTMLNIAGDPQFVMRAQSINNAPGGVVAEETTGTNAISLAIRFQEPNFMSGPEHYCQFFHDWNCYAVPIFNWNNERLIGVLDLTGPSGAFNNHTFGLIQAGAYAIEKVIHKHYLIREYHLLNHYVQQLTFRSDLIMAINLDHVILNFQDNRSITVRPGETKIGMTLEDTQLSEVSRYLYADDSIASFQIYSQNEKYYECKLSKIIHDHEFIGWILHANVRTATAFHPAKTKGSALDQLIGKSPSFMKALHLAKKVGGSNATILILGETGTGKEEFAKSIHLDSARRDYPFISINCGAIPKELIASELFGYEEGAFSGAKRGGAKGKFESAKGGTIFLDEIGELPLDQQVYLLRVLQERKMQRVGGTKDIPLDVRIIAATNVDLSKAVDDKTFRKDLYYRLNVVTIRLPSLVERGPEDIGALAEFFLEKYNQIENKRVVFSEDVLNRLCRHAWPGNVRELENMIYKLVVLSEEEVQLDDFDFIFDSTREDEADAWDQEERVEPDETKPAHDHHLSGFDKMEMEEISKSLIKNNRNISKAAKSLGISRSTFYRKLNKYKIQ